MDQERLDEIKKGSAGDPVKTELMTEIESLRSALVDVLGSMHVINYEARHVRRWIKDPNVDVERACLNIEEYRLKMHDRIVGVLTPKEIKVARTLMA